MGYCSLMSCWSCFKNTSFPVLKSLYFFLFSVAWWLVICRERSVFDTHVLLTLTPNFSFKENDIGSLYGLSLLVSVQNPTGNHLFLCARDFGGPASCTTRECCQWAILLCFQPTVEAGSCRTFDCFTTVHRLVKHKQHVSSSTQLPRMPSLPVICSSS